MSFILFLSIVSMITKAQQGGGRSIFFWDPFLVQNTMAQKLHIIQIWAPVHI